MEEIIKIAANSKSVGLKGNAVYRYSLKNKNCGDHIKIEFNTKNEKITNFRYEGETCIFCQASSSLVSKNQNKLTLQKLFNLKKQIYDYFDNKCKNEQLVIFDFKQLLKKKNNSRKECIALPINAILNALEKNDCR